jgi:hypothetical protein
VSISERYDVTVLPVGSVGVAEASSGRVLTSVAVVAVVVMSRNGFRCHTMVERFGGIRVESQGSPCCASLTDTTIVDH